MRLTFVVGFGVLVFAAGGCKRESKGPKKDEKVAAALPDAEPAAKPIPPPPLPPVTGETSVATGAKVFAAKCASCHGDDGKGKGPAAAALPLAPTDLTSVRYLCRSTNGRPVAVPSDVDVEGAIERGTHKGNADLAAIAPAERRSLTMYVKTLAKDFAGDPQPLSEVPKETLDDASSRARGRMIYLNWGCWVCHGAGGKGDGDPKAVSVIVWNNRPVPMGDLTAHDKYLCGNDPERVYRTIALGEAMIMPSYGSMAELSWRPDGKPEDWGKQLEAHISADEIAAFRAYAAQQPEKHEVTDMKPADRHARGAALLWDLVHYVRSL